LPKNWVCRLPWIELGFNEETYAEYYTAITGVKVTLNELLKKSNDIYDLTRAINVRRGIGKKDDYPPERNFDLAIATGPQAGKKLDREEFEKILSIYYAKRKWTKDGVPDIKTIEARHGNPGTQSL
jgi:aldehyde:ferredoxin oxidoreductase